MIAPVRPALKPPAQTTILARMTDIRKPRRRWLRYSLITLLVLVVSAGIAMSWIAHRLQRSVRQHEAVEAILKTGGVVRFDFEIDQSGNSLAEASPPGPAWLRYWLGDDLCSNVVEAEVQTDTALECVKDLPQLQRLHLFSSGITDVGLPRFAATNRTDVRKSLPGHRTALFLVHWLPVAESPPASTSPSPHRVISPSSHPVFVSVNS